MPSDEKTPFYDPVPPTYDEALASGSRRGYVWDPARSSIDNRDADEVEQQSLLRQPETAAGPSRQPPRGYRPPTVETDDEFSLLGSDSELDSDEEAAQIRREMQEMEVEEPSTSIGSVWSKRIGFSLSLPKWKWSWRPRLPRFRIQLPSRATEPTRNENEAETETSTDTPRQWPRMNSMALIIVFARLIALLIVLGFIYFLFATGFFSGFSTRLPGGLRFDPEDLKAFLQSNVDPMRMRASVLHYSHYAHIAGTEGDYAMAMDVESMFHRAGLESVQLDKYYVYVNYPRKDGRAVQIMDTDGKTAKWTAKLDEEERGGEAAGRQTYAFHAHSKSGDVKGPLIYANYGSPGDFQKLKDEGIDTKGAIALVRQMGTQKDVALKVKAAELAGFAGCLIYSDPAENGFVKGDVAPKGRWMPEDGVQRGSVSLKNMGVGDVLTPGWESKKEKQRMAVEDAPGLVKIPSLPLAWRDAKVLLQQLKGHGQQVPDGWKGSVPEVDEWWTGDHSSPVVRLQNEQDEIEKQPVWNVYGKILGMEQTSNSIILGNHRDSMAFGASQPHSGTAVMIELARIFGNLLSRGWRPLRTIEFMSWDAAEYNMVGSTEYVEMNLDTLRQNAYAYINLDAAITGTQFTAAGSPPLDRALIRALERVVDPFKNETLKYQWDSRKATLQGLGGGGDYVPFQDIAGTSSIDLKFEGEPVPFGSSYESFNLVEQVIDPNFIYHGLMGQVVGLLLLDLADRAIMPFDMVGYARSLNHWVHDLEYWVNKQKTAKDGASKIPFQELKDAVELVKSNAEEFEKWELEWDRSILSSGGYEANGLGTQRINYNDRMAAFEASLLDLELGGGIPNRTQFKHVVFGPQLWSTYDASFFPAIRDTVEAGDWELARLLTAKTAALLRKAATILQM
ncbi:Glutamate carboxypeptidase 2 [Metarhizium brunneum]|uniref:Glutamate carboxypeptidase 2 n=1 Tax=Metarhizium brunneum TaxID=500148 RepID=A0A7D5V6Q7_9HYPO